MSTQGSSSSQSIPFKVKKTLMDSPSSKSAPVKPNQASVDLSTPEKPLENLFTRSRNRSVALSVKEIRQAAGSRRRSEDLEVNKTSSAKSKLVFSSNDSSVSKQIFASKNSEKDTLPEKYEILGKFFDALDSSLMLLKLRGNKSTFLTVSGQIEHLTERRFGYNHLAQLKHILPEAIEIKKVLIYNEPTGCMKPDLHVTLNPDAVKINDKSKSESKKISLRKVFRSRLADFVKSHPQGDEVPEDPLPELYNRRKPNENSAVETRRSSVMEKMASIPSSILTSTPLKLTSTPIEPASTPAKPTSSQINFAPTPNKATSETNTELYTPIKPVSKQAIVPSTPAILLSTPANIDSKPVIADSTPPAFASTPARLFSTSLATAAHLKKRSGGYINQDDVFTDPPVKLARRSMNFDSYKDDKKAMNVTDDDKPIDQLPEEDSCSDDEFLNLLSRKLRKSLKEQERKAIEDSNPAISLAKRRRKMIASLPKLFNAIHYLIQSIKRWVITKEELVCKIISGHSEITDKKEVEEQLALMQEFVPEWISEKLSSDGELLVCINKLASPEKIRAVLEKENKKAMTPLPSDSSAALPSDSSSVLSL